MTIEITSGRPRSESRKRRAGPARLWRSPVRDRSGTTFSRPAGSRLLLRQPQAFPVCRVDPLDQILAGFNRPRSIDQGPDYLGFRHLPVARPTGETSRALLVEFYRDRRHSNTMILPYRKGQMPRNGCAWRIANFLSILEFATHRVFSVASKAIASLTNPRRTFR